MVVCRGMLEMLVLFVIVGDIGLSRSSRKLMSSFMVI